MPPGEGNQTRSHPSPCANLLVLGTRVDAVESYQDKQNGHLANIASDVAKTPDKIDATRRELQAGIDTLRNWILATLATTLIGVGIAILSFVLKGGQP